jgi:hypothetical protein
LAARATVSRAAADHAAAVRTALAAVAARTARFKGITASAGEAATHAMTAVRVATRLQQAKMALLVEVLLLRLLLVQLLIMQLSLLLPRREPDRPTVPVD